MVTYYQKYDGKLQSVMDGAAPWIHVTSPLDNAELEHLASSEDIPLDFLIDSLDIDERSRYEREDEVRLIVINVPVINSDEKESDALYITAPIGIIMKADKTITISSTENEVIDRFLQQRVRNFDPADQRRFVLQIFQYTVLQFLDVLKKLNSRRNVIEKELYSSSRNRELRQLLKIEKSLVYMLNSLSDNDLLKQKMKRTDFLNVRSNEEYQDLFEDIIIDNSQALEMANVHTNLLSSTMEAYASIISNNLNVIIHRLTTITIVLMVPTIVFSFYGMNVTLPMEEHPATAYLLILLSLILSVVLIAFFRRKDNI
ncbi:MAG: magnesium transporter [Saprospiraceae bacterium]|jgi:magnesium transporter